MIQGANQAGETKRLREEIPPASWPITSEFGDRLQPIDPLTFYGMGACWSMPAAREHAGRFIWRMGSS